MDNRPRFSGIAAIGFAAVLSLLLALPAFGKPATRSISGERAGDRVSFRVAALRGSRLQGAYVVVGNRRYRVSVRVIRRAVRRGKLTVRVTKRPAKTRIRRKPPVLVIGRRPLRPVPASAVPAAPAPTSPLSPVLVVVVGPAPAPSSLPAPAAQPSPATPAAPVPAAPVPSSCPVVLAAFAGGAGPPSCWRPYADDSPFNRRIAASPELAPRSADYVAQLTRIGPPDAIATGTAGTVNDWAHPTFYSLPTDALYTIDCTESWGTCAIEGMRVRVPLQAQPAGGGDAHLTIVDTATGWEYDLWGASSLPAPGGTIRTRWGGRTRIDGDGLDSDATAARFGNLAGMIRAPELAAGRIDHALFMTYPCGTVTPVYPATKGGALCDATTGVNAFPMGTRFQLDMSDAEIDALGFARWKTAILKAMAEYGMYFGDTGGNSWAVMAESSSTYTAFGLEDPLLAIARQAGYRQGSDGIAWLDLASGVDWRGRLRALSPCSARGTC